MTGRPMEEVTPTYCSPCQKEGMAIPATRMVNGVPKCEACFRVQGAIIEKPKEEEKPKMTTTAIDWAKIQRRRNAGENVEAIAKELGVSGATVYNHTKAPVGISVHATPKIVRKSKTVVAKASSNGLLAELKAEYEALKTIIEFLEKRQ